MQKLEDLEAGMLITPPQLSPICRSIPQHAATKRQHSAIQAIVLPEIGKVYSPYCAALRSSSAKRGQLSCSIS
ncbi:hypothetical protein D3C75_97870 [compost metagenome]